MQVNAPVRAESYWLTMASKVMLGTNENEIMANPEFWSDTASTPSRQWYWRILAQNVDGTVTSFGLAMEVILEYDIVFKNWKEEGVSSKKPGFGGIRKGGDAKKTK